METKNFNNTVSLVFKILERERLTREAEKEEKLNNFLSGLLAILFVLILVLFGMALGKII